MKGISNLNSVEGNMGDEVRNRFKLISLGLSRTLIDFKNLMIEMRVGVQPCWHPVAATGAVALLTS